MRTYLRCQGLHLKAGEPTKRSAVKWSVYRARPKAEQEIRSWFGFCPRNIALGTGNGVVVVDMDERALVSKVVECCGSTPMRCRTPSGMHLYYAAPEDGMPSAVHVNDMPIDIRSDGAHAVCPWSRNAAGVPYEWVDGVVPAADLPPIDASWLRTRTPRRIVTPEVSLCDPSTATRRARGYLAHIEGAIAENDGMTARFASRACWRSSSA